MPKLSPYMSQKVLFENTNLQQKYQSVDGQYEIHADYVIIAVRYSAD